MLLKRFFAAMMNGISLAELYNDERQRVLAVVFPQD